MRTFVSYAFFGITCIVPLATLGLFISMILVWAMVFSGQG